MGFFKKISPAYQAISKITKSDSVPKPILQTVAEDLISGVKKKKRSSTTLTGARGVQEDASTAKKSLLGS